MHAPPPITNVRSDIPKEVEKVIMSALEIDSKKRPATVSEWISALEKATENIRKEENTGNSRLIILASIEAEVYIDDERKGSIGSSGRLILSSVPAGRHVLRVSKPGVKDDERVIEIREDAEEQVIQAKLKPLSASNSHPTPSNAGNSGTAPSSLMPEIVVCTTCSARFAEGVKFCGRCGNRSFYKIGDVGDEGKIPCPRCGTNASASAKFCGCCGLKLEQSENVSQRQFQPESSSFPSNPSKQGVKICNRCGVKIPANAKFCGWCGNDLI
jgi:NADH pyrophosphatase NudC (nudix superfamily)